MDTMVSEESSKVISDFLTDWKLASHYYHNFAEAVADKCRRALKSQSINATITYRAKEGESLAEKLYQRSKLKPHLYKDKAAIFHDIQDLAGVRIAVNTSVEIKVVDHILRKELDVEKYTAKTDSSTTSTGNLKRQHIWYSGNHYVAHRKQDDTELQSFREETRVEIQVLSRFRSALAEREHDVVYKERSGPVTPKIHKLFDNVAGMVGILDSLLDLDLDGSDQERELPGGSFENIHELGACLSRLIAKYSRDYQEGAIGPLEGLRRLLKFRKLDNPNSLEDLYGQLESTPINTNEAIIKSYGNIQPRVSVLMMDYIIFSLQPSPRQSDIDRFAAREIFSVIISTFVWLNELFTPATTWQSKLLSQSYRYSDEVRHKDLPWLFTTRLEELRDSEIIGPEDEERLRRIARWLDHHTERPVKLVFSISSLDSSFWRGLDDEWHLYAQASSEMKRLRTDAIP